MNVCEVMKISRDRPVSPSCGLEDAARAGHGEFSAFLSAQL